MMYFPVNPDRPIKLELSVQDIMTISLNLDVFKKNGFKVEIPEEESESNFVSIKSLPYSKNFQFT